MYPPNWVDNQYPTNNMPRNPYSSKGYMWQSSEPPSLIEPLEYVYRNPLPYTTPDENRYHDVWTDPNMEQQIVVESFKTQTNYQVNRERTKIRILPEVKPKWKYMDIADKYRENTTIRRNSNYSYSQNHYQSSLNPLNSSVHSKVINTNKKCRGCLKSDKTFEYDVDQQQYFTSIKVKPDFTNSAGLCFNCAEELKLAYNFRKKCLKANKDYKTLLSIKDVPMYETPKPKYQNHHQSMMEYDKSRIGPFECNLCGKIVRTYKGWKNHKIKHGADLNIMCEECGKSFMHESKLHMHIKKEHSIKRFEMFGRDYMSMNIQNEYGVFEDRENIFLKSLFPGSIVPYNTNAVGRFECEICCKVIKSIKTMELHRQKHIRELDLMCDECGKCFTNERKLNLHIRTKHPKYDENSMEYMNKDIWIFKSTYSADSTILQKRPYMGPFECDLCCKLSKTRQDMEYHNQRHMKQLDLVCEECGKGFSYKEKLELHKKMKHSRYQQDVDGYGYDGTGYGKYKTGNHGKKKFKLEDRMESVDYGTNEYRWDDKIQANNFAAQEYNNWEAKLETSDYDTSEFANKWDDKIQASSNYMINDYKYADPIPMNSYNTHHQAATMPTMSTMSSLSNMNSYTNFQPTPQPAVIVPNIIKQKETYPAVVAPKNELKWTDKLKSFTDKNVLSWQDKFKSNPFSKADFKLDEKLKPYIGCGNSTATTIPVNNNNNNINNNAIKSQYTDAVPIMYNNNSIPVAGQQQYGYNNGMNVMNTMKPAYTNDSISTYNSYGKEPLKPLNQYNYQDPVVKPTPQYIYQEPIQSVNQYNYQEPVKPINQYNYPEPVKPIAQSAYNYQDQVKPNQTAYSYPEPVKPATTAYNYQEPVKSTVGYNYQDPIITKPANQYNYQEPVKPYPNVNVTNEYNVTNEFKYDDQTVPYNDNAHHDDDDDDDYNYDDEGNSYNDDDDNDDEYYNNEDTNVTSYTDVNAKYNYEETMKSYMADANEYKFDDKNKIEPIAKAIEPIIKIEEPKKIVEPVIVPPAVIITNGAKMQTQDSYEVHDYNIEEHLEPFPEEDDEYNYDDDEEISKPDTYDHDDDYDDKNESYPTEDDHYDDDDHIDMSEHAMKVDVPIVEPKTNDIKKLDVKISPKASEIKMIVEEVKIDKENVVKITDPIKEEHKLESDSNLNDHDLKEDDKLESYEEGQDDKFEEDVVSFTEEKNEYDEEDQMNQEGDDKKDMELEEIPCNYCGQVYDNAFECPYHQQGTAA